MRNNTYTNSARGYSYYADRFKVEVAHGSVSAEKSTDILQNVSSSVNSLPYSVLKVQNHSFEKISVSNTLYVIAQQGYYIQRPFVQNIYAYGRIFPGNFVFQSTPVLNYDISSVEARAYEKLLGKLRGSHANLAVDAAEGRQTLRMLKSAVQLKKLVFEFVTSVITTRGYKKIRRGPTQGQRRRAYVNGKWLEYRYGWSPLVQTIYDVADAAVKQQLLGLTVLKARSGVKKENFIKSGTGSYSDPRFQTHIQGSARVEFGGVFDLPSGPNVSDWTSLNPAGIAWELVPFSFIADWLIGVGQYLENAENYFLFRNTFRAGYKTYTYIEKRTQTFFGANHYPLRYYFGGGTWNISDDTYDRVRFQSTQVTYKKKSRVKLISLPTPYGPRVKVNLNSKRLLDSAALISQYVQKSR